MNIDSGKKYLRMEATVYIELKEGEEPAEAEDRFLCGLPKGMDCASYHASMWFPDEEE